MKCIACCNDDIESPLEGDALDMFNFVCCLEITEPEELQGICKECNEELKISFNFKKRCLEIFANIYKNPEDEPEDDDFFRNLLDQSLHEDENSLNLNDLLIPEICLGGNTALSMLDVSDNTKCRYCFTEFGSKSECLTHMECHKGDEKPYKCPQEGCSSSFKARKNLKDHYLVHSNERPFPCHFCEQTFKSSSNRSKHERRIHGRERMEIKNAAKEQELKSKLAEKVIDAKPTPPSSDTSSKAVQEKVTEAIVQLSTSTDDGDERGFRCDHDGCVSTFKTRSSLRDHQKVHSDLRPYICAFCSSAFKSSSNRSKHERGSHSQQYQKRKLDREHQRNGDAEEATTPKRVKLTLPTPKVIKQEPVVTQRQKVTDFPCRYCDRIFKKAENRDRHEATHKDFNAFDCGFCSKNFKTQEALKAHTKTHTEPAKLSCSHAGCENVYQDRRSLKEHESSHTLLDEAVEYICDEGNCGRVYTSPKALRNHKKMKHNDDDDDEISCDICSSSFKKSELAEHLRIHI